VFVSSVICVHLSRFPLVVAADGRRELLTEPVALAPEPGRTPVIGEVSPAAEAAGVRRGLPLGEALARCPRLRLLPPDPVAVQTRWDDLVGRLEGIGAAVETAQDGDGAGTGKAAPGEPGTAWFSAGSVRRMHGGSLDGTVAAVRGALGMSVRIGVAPTRFLSRVAAGRARVRRPVVLEAPAVGAPAAVGALGILAGEPVSVLALRPELVRLVPALERLGIATLGELLALPPGTVGERFGRAGLLAQELLRGEEAPLRPRDPTTRLEADLLLPEAASGEQLGHALGLLIDRVLAHPARRHRPLRSVLLQATLVERGTWQERVVLREAMSDPARIRLALGQRLDALPSPAERLTLRVDGFGVPVPADRPLLEEDDAIRRARLREAVRQVREVAGPDGALRVVAVDPDSRVAERRMALTPFEP
jgi:protein ImuB